MLNIPHGGLRGFQVKAKAPSRTGRSDKYTEWGHEHLLEKGVRPSQTSRPHPCRTRPRCARTPPKPQRLAAARPHGRVVTVLKTRSRPVSCPENRARLCGMGRFARVSSTLRIENTFVKAHRLLNHSTQRSRAYLGPVSRVSRRRRSRQIANTWKATKCPPPPPPATHTPNHKQGLAFRGKTRALFGCGWCCTHASRHMCTPVSICN
jgi:hypothetical protein